MVVKIFSAVDGAGRGLNEWVAPLTSAPVYDKIRCKIDDKWKVGVAMQTVPQITPLSDLRDRQQEVLSMMDNAPVILAEESKARAVLVSVETWNRIVKEMKRSRLLEEVERIHQRNEREQSWVNPMEQLERLEEKHGAAMFESIRKELDEHVAG